MRCHPSRWAARPWGRFKCQHFRTQDFAGGDSATVRAVRGKSQRDSTRSRRPLEVSVDGCRTWPSCRHLVCASSSLERRTNKRCISTMHPRTPLPEQVHRGSVDELGTTEASDVEGRTATGRLGGKDGRTWQRARCRVCVAGAGLRASMRTTCMHSAHVRAACTCCQSTVRSTVRVRN